MTKRMFESDLLGEEWFMELAPEYANLWLQMNLRCNKGGIVVLNSRLLSFWANFDVDIEAVGELFKDHVTIFNDKIFIHQFFANQNGFNLKISDDAVRGCLKSYFEHEELNEDLLRSLGYRFFAGPKDNLFEIKNVKEYIFQYRKSLQALESVEKKYLIDYTNTKYTTNASGVPLGTPIGKPRNSNSNSNSNRSSNSNSSGIVSSNGNGYESYQELLKKYPNMMKIEKQLKKDEYKSLLNLETPKKFNLESLKNAMDDIEKDKNCIVNNSVFESLQDRLTLPF